MGALPFILAAAWNYFWQLLSFPRKVPRRCRQRQLQTKAGSWELRPPTLDVATLDVAGLLQPQALNLTQAQATFQGDSGHSQASGGEGGSISGFAVSSLPTDTLTVLRHCQALGAGTHSLPVSFPASSGCRHQGTFPDSPLQLRFPSGAFFPKLPAPPSQPRHLSLST